jgi:hypothetical protein
MADLRRCIGSARFGIEAHDAPIADFPSQPSQKDGLGRMCKPHWNQYTAGLARDAKARKAAEMDGAPAPAAEREATIEADAKATRKAKRTAAADDAIEVPPNEAA